MPGHLWNLLERWAEAQPEPPNQTQIAQALGMSKQALAVWKQGGTLPRPEALRAVARLTGLPHAQVLEAGLLDGGYLLRGELGVGATVRAAVTAPHSPRRRNPKKTARQS